MIITLKTKFAIGQLVWHVVPGENNQGVITGILLRENNRYLYDVTWADLKSGNHDEMELSDQKPMEF